MTTSASTYCFVWMHKNMHSVQTHLVLEKIFGWTTSVAVSSCWVRVRILDLSTCITWHTSNHKKGIVWYITVQAVPVAPMWHRPIEADFTPMQVIPTTSHWNRIHFNSHRRTLITQQPYVCILPHARLLLLNFMGSFTSQVVKCQLGLHEAGTARQHNWRPLKKGGGAQHGRI